MFVAPCSDRALAAGRDGLLYTYGPGSRALPELPIVAGFRVCEGNEASIFDCAEHGNGLADDVCAASGLDPGCSSPEDRDCAGGCSPDAASGLPGRTHGLRTLSPGMCPT